MSISVQNTLSPLNGSSACAFSDGKPSGNNELIEGIPGNAVKLPTFNVYEGLPPFGNAYNGSPLVWGNVWKHYGQLYTSDFDYKTYLGNNWLANFPSYKDLGSTALSKQSKVLKMFGSGTNFPNNTDVNKQNIDNSRGATDTNIPLVGFSETSPAASFGSDSVWSKHEWFQEVKRPNDAVTMKFGAYVRVDENDDFRDKNCGGVYTWQKGSSQEQYTDTINAIVVKKSTDSMNLVTGLIDTEVDSYQQWNGMLAHAPEYPRKSTRTDIQNISYVDNTDCRNFRKIESTITLIGYNHGDVGIGLFFGENQSNLDESGALSGAIQFYCPFIQFFDSNGDLIPCSNKAIIKITNSSNSSGSFIFYYKGFQESQILPGATRTFPIQIEDQFTKQFYFYASSDSSRTFASEPVVTGGTLTSSLTGEPDGFAYFTWDGGSRLYPEDEITITATTE